MLTEKGKANTQISLLIAQFSVNCQLLLVMAWVVFTVYGSLKSLT